MGYKDFTFLGYMIPLSRERKTLVDLISNMSSVLEFRTHLAECDKSSLEDDEWPVGDPEAPAEYGDDNLYKYATARITAELDRFLVKKYHFVKANVHNSDHRTQIVHVTSNGSTTYLAFGFPAEGLSYTDLQDLAPEVQKLQVVALLEFKFEDPVSLVSSTQLF
jgi:hypothetical protein